MDINTVKDLANLARIELTDEEEKRFAGELESILKYISQLQELEGEDVNSEIIAPNRFREDKNPHGSGEFSEVLLNEAPKRKGDFISVKKIIENGKN